MGTEMAQETRRLAAFVAGLQRADIPDIVAKRAKMLLVDTLGIVIRARHDADSTQSLLAMVQAAGLHGRGATVFGDGADYGPAAAALINGTLAHSLDFDDTHAPGSLHPSAPVIPAALAAAEMTDAPPALLLTGIVAGYETVCRISMALDPPKHYDRGFHPSATAGCFGAAAAAGRVLGLDAAGQEHAFGVSLSQAAGTLQFLVNGAWNKRYQVGAAAMNGLIAALLARAGFKGAAEAIEGRHGFLQGYSPAPKPHLVAQGLGAVWETLAIAIKPYPACRFTHAALDAILDMAAAHKFDADQVRAVKIGLPKKGIDLVGEPQSAKRRARNVVDGQFSMHFVAAAALRVGRFGWDDYRLVGDPLIDALSDRIEVWNDPMAEAEYPALFSASVDIATERGRFRRFVACPKGEPANFFELPELKAKFAGLAAPYLAPGAADQAAERLLDIEHTGLRAALRPKLAAAAGRRRVATA
jgi:2-methylcitrate dehydratase PrpD